MPVEVVQVRDRHHVCRCPSRAYGLHSITGQILRRYVELDHVGSLRFVRTPCDVVCVQRVRNRVEVFSLWWSWKLGPVGSLDPVEFVRADRVVEGGRGWWCWWAFGGCFETRTLAARLKSFGFEHGKPWRVNKDETWTWDESYTISENLFLAYQRGAGERYRDLARQYLDDEYYDPLAEGHNNLAGRHAYSHVNSLSSAMQAYLTLGSEKHLRAARNGFEMLSRQSFVTGGWGPDESLPAPDSEDVAASLTGTHASFETPCGSYAHFKLTRYLLRVTHDPRYGDSMERVMYNTVLGAKPLQPDGRNFYYSDCNFKGRKVYKEANWSCCSGTLPQVAADYRINTYFRDPNGVFVNLYIPSTLRFVQHGALVSMTQRSGYPFDGLVQLDVSMSKATEFAMRFRIPEWADGASASVNSGPVVPLMPGVFVTIHRQWKTGDRVELHLPMTMRLHPVDPQHSGIVALLCGPIVLFAITNEAPTVTRRQLLAAQKIGTQTWQVETTSGLLKMLPFTAIGDEQYSTYLRVE